MADEVIKILQMLQEGKISVEEATALLDATERALLDDPDPAPDHTMPTEQRLSNAIQPESVRR